MGRKRIGGRYRLLEARARGGMAAVWRGRDEQTGDAVAVKVLHPHIAEDADARERLQREASAMQAVDHPNVVAVRDVLVDHAGAAMVMDFVDGQSLAERIADGPLPEPEAVRIATEVADGLAEAHAQGIVHRDVKPGNILLDAEDRVRLTDFGIAASLEAGADERSLTREHGVVGTLRYLAPERLLGEAAVPATDVWGVGAVLYEMLAGAPAYPASTVAERTDPNREHPARPAAVSDATWAVVERAMAGDPTRRYADGAALGAALRALGASSVDPGADTVVIATPVAVPSMAGSATASATSAPASAAAPIGPAVRRTRWGDRPLAPVLVGVTLAAVGAVAVLAMGFTGPSTPDEAVSTAAPPARVVEATPLPTEATPLPTEAPARGKPDKDDKLGKGNGKGKGG